MRRTIATFALMVLVLSSAGCGDADSADSDVIYGTWVTELEGKYQPSTRTALGQESQTRISKRPQTRGLSPSTVRP